MQEILDGETTLNEDITSICYLTWNNTSPSKSTILCFLQRSSTPTSLSEIAVYICNKKMFTNGALQSQNLTWTKREQEPVHLKGFWFTTFNNGKDLSVTYQMFSAKWKKEFKNHFPWHNTLRERNVHLRLRLNQTSNICQILHFTGCTWLSRILKKQVLQNNREVIISLLRLPVIQTLAPIHHQKAPYWIVLNIPTVQSAFFQAFKTLTWNSCPKLITILGSSGFSWGSKSLSPHSLITSQSSNISLQMCCVAMNPLLSEREPLCGLKFVSKPLALWERILNETVPSVFFFGNVRFRHSAHSFVVWKRIDGLSLHVLVGQIVEDCHFGHEAPGL